MHSSVIIIGAGAAGLACAMKFSVKGHSVTVLEAKEHIGGRAHSGNVTGFSTSIDAGAEFIHGNLSCQSSLMAVLS